jgi:hypothetical protein
MANAIYMDVHVPMAITAGLRRLGFDVLTSQLDGTTTIADADLLVRATQLRRILFTQDDDLLRIASEWQHVGRPFAGVVYAHQLSAGIGTLIRDLQLLLECCRPDELADRVTYLPLSN